MFGNGRKTIGVFATQIHQEYQGILAKGISKRAGELGYNVAFFTNFLGYNDMQYLTGERNVAALPSYADLAGIIMLPDTMFDDDLLEYIKENIKKYSHCPVVSIRQKIEGYYNVLINDDSILDKIIRHFIADHGYRKINFLTGPKENPVSLDRLETYKRVLAEYRIPYEEERVYYADFWKILPNKAIDYWLSDPGRMPEAIVCANDYMAITVCNALIEKGYSVPEDIGVSGCDNIIITKDFCPTITTVGMPILEMGIEAVEKIDKHSKNVLQDRITYLDTQTFIRESCGCSQLDTKEETTIRRNRIINDVESKERHASGNAFMSVEFTTVKTVDDLDRRLGSYIYLNDGLTSFYMCLHKNWDELSVNSSMDAKPCCKEMIMEAGMKNGEWLQQEEFMAPDLLPAKFIDPEPQVFLFNMLHYQEVCFGYTAISFQDYGVYKSSYQGWLINISNALENIRMNNKLNQLVYRLEDMSIKDELTNLYNRRAMETLGQKYLKRCVDERSNLMIFTADVDKLKYINDNFGHASGDIAIKTVADALMSAAEDDEICIRISGDEFVVIGMDYDQEKMDRFLARFDKKINCFNMEEEFAYKVFVSYGWSIIQPHDNITIEDCLLVADAKMYQQKNEKQELHKNHEEEMSLEES